MSKLRSIFSRGGYACPYCGTKLKKSEMFCPNCGQPRVEDAPAYADYGYAAPAAEPAYAAAPAGYVCPACGNPMEEGDRFCMNCGARREDAPAAPEPATPVGFAEAAFANEAPVFTNEAPAFAQEPFVPRPETSEPRPEAFAAGPAPMTAVFMTGDGEMDEAEAQAGPEAPAAEECAPADEPECGDVSADSSESYTLFDAIDEAAIWGRPAQQSEAPAEEAAPAPEAIEEEAAGSETAEEAAVEEPEAIAEPAAAEVIAADSATGEAAPVAAEDSGAAALCTDGSAPAPKPAAAKASTYGLKFIADPTRDVCILHSGAMIGRMAGCSLVIDEPSISRRHCHIDLIDNVWKLIVLGVNGIVVDGDHFSNEYGRPIALSDGCIIEFPGIGGNIAVQFMENPF